jgi:hypothetical protein
LLFSQFCNSFDNAKNVGHRAFLNCSSLTNLILPKSITNIGDFAFYDCSQVKNIYYRGTATDWQGISIGSFNACLISANRYYYSENEPNESENFWHYDENGDVVIW